MPYVAAVILATLCAVLDCWRSFAGAIGLAGSLGAKEMLLIGFTNAAVVGVLGFVPVTLAWYRLFHDRPKTTGYLPEGFIGAKIRGYTVGCCLCGLVMLPRQPTWRERFSLP